MMAQDSNHKDNILTKLYSLPVVHDVVNKAGNLYAETKNYSPLVKFTLNTAETGLGLAAFTAKPVLMALEKLMGALDGFAVNKLNQLEKEYPILNKPTNEVIAESKLKLGAAIKPFSDRLQPVTDKVTGIANCTKAKVDAVKNFTSDNYTAVITYGANKVNNLRSYAVQKVTLITDAATDKISVVMEMETTRMLITKIDLYLVDLEKKVHAWLPPVEHDRFDSEACRTRSLTFPLISRLSRTACFVARRSLGYTVCKVMVMRERVLALIERLEPQHLKAFLCNTWCTLKERICCIWCEITNSTAGRKLKNFEMDFVSSGRMIAMRLKAEAEIFLMRLKQIPSKLEYYLPEYLKKVLAAPWNYLNNSTVVSRNDKTVNNTTYTHFYTTYTHLKTRANCLIVFASNQMTSELVKKPYTWLYGEKKTESAETENKEEADSFQSAGNCNSEQSE